MKTLIVCAGIAGPTVAYRVKRSVVNPPSSRAHTGFAEEGMPSTSGEPASRSPRGSDWASDCGTSATASVKLARCPTAARGSLISTRSGYAARHSRRLRSGERRSDCCPTHSDFERLRGLRAALTRRPLGWTGAVGGRAGRPVRALRDRRSPQSRWPGR